MLPMEGLTFRFMTITYYHNNHSIRVFYIRALCCRLLAVQIGIVLLDAANLWRDVSGMLQNIGVYYQNGGVAHDDRPLGETSTRS